MKRRWHPDGLIENFTLSSQDKSLLSGHTPTVQLGRIVLLTCMRYEGRFPDHPRNVLAPVIEYLAQQLGLTTTEFAQYDWSGRRGQTDREAIRERLSFRVTGREDYADLASWLTHNALLKETHDIGHLRNAMLDHLRGQGIEPLSTNQLDCLIRIGLREFEVSLFQNTSGRYPHRDTT